MCVPQKVENSVMINGYSPSNYSERGLIFLDNDATETQKWGSELNDHHVTFWMTFLHEFSQWVEGATGMLTGWFVAATEAAAVRKIFMRLAMKHTKTAL